MEPLYVLNEYLENNAIIYLIIGAMIPLICRGVLYDRNNKNSLSKLFRNLALISVFVLDVVLQIIGDSYSYIYLVCIMVSNIAVHLWLNTIWNFDSIKNRVLRLLAAAGYGAVTFQITNALLWSLVAFIEMSHFD